MEDDMKILVSNIGLPSSKIGSWITRLNRFNEKNVFFDAILSPSNASDKHYYCKKRNFLTWNQRLRKQILLKWVAKDFIRAALKLSRDTNKLSVVIMDDPHLVEAFVLRKEKFHCPIEIIYSFHGFQLNLKEQILNKIDKILFLSNSGYQSSKGNYFAFIPEVHIIGNCVDSEQFFPLNDTEKIKLKESLGYTQNDKILVWMANERPVKGLHLFKKIVAILLKTHPQLKILVLGSKKGIDHPNIKNLGKIPNHQIAKYLQVGNYYMFTSLCKEGFGLSMIEAYKSGNTIIVSNNGAIKEVTKELKNVYLVENPNSVQNWVSVFEESLKDNQSKITYEEVKSIWNYDDWEKRFINALVN